MTQKCQLLLFSTTLVLAFRNNLNPADVENPASEQSLPRQCVVWLGYSIFMCLAAFNEYFP